MSGRHGILILLLFCGCGGQQSALSPAGRSAEQLALLFWIMVIGAAVIWLIVIGLGLFSLLRPETGSARKAAIYIIGGGVVFPTLVLTALLCYGLAALPAQVQSAPEGSLQVTVTGHQWWWDVQYHRPEGSVVRLANELHLPVDEPVQIYLKSGDVIHSFWIPSLGGKIDMIPGRRTQLALQPTKTGIYRGVCAEFCGESHALMSFYVVVQEREEFDKWLSEQAEPAQAPSSEIATRGHDAVLANGCASCHGIRGTEAEGKIGPDLTHVGSRLSLAADALPNDREAFSNWITAPKAVKPDAQMPHFSHLPPEEIEAMAAYLDGLE